MGVVFRTGPYRPPADVGQSSRMGSSLIWLLLILGCVVNLSQQNPGRVLSRKARALPDDDELAKMVDFLKEALENATKQVGESIDKEAAIAADPPKGAESANAFKGAQSMLSSSPYVKKMSLTANQQLAALQSLKEEYTMTNNEVKQFTKHYVSLLGPGPDEIGVDALHVGDCPYPDNDQSYTCYGDPKYRSIDGSCNNLDKPLWGMSNRPLARFLEPDYADGINVPRAGMYGEELPAARQVSLAIHQEKEKPSNFLTLLFMTFGQILDHDVTKTAASKLSLDAEGGGMLVDFTCGDDGCQTDGVENSACYPIMLEDDPDYDANQNCIKFVRSEAVVNEDCTIGPREQLNQITSFIDASMVYGSGADVADRLRDHSDPNRGKMKLTENFMNPHGDGLLPQKDDPDCKNVSDTIRCFEAGDARANAYIGLTAFHTVFQRFHNVIEEQLYNLGNNWDGETLYQESRRILGAVWQNIVINEYLPLLLGSKLVKKYDLKPKKNGYFKGYNKEVNPAITNVFATAAYRYGHSQITNMLRFAAQKYTDFDEEAFSLFYFSPYELYSTSRPGGTGVDSIILGQISQPAEGADRFFTKEATVRLFSANPPHGTGSDLAARNIQRGRDHGLPSYNEWRKWCDLKPAKDFDKMEDIQSEEVRNKFKDLYEYVDDVDLYPAAMAEKHVSGGSVGPTFACILAHQFRNLRAGDRFWYEGEEAGFTEDQLKEIRKMTLAKVFCESLDEVDTIQKHVLLQPKELAVNYIGDIATDEAYDVVSLYKDNNARQPCSDLPSMDFSRWKTPEEE